MRRLAIVAVGLVAGFGIAAQPAFATFHLNMVNEVMLASSSGDTSVQFVEFLDHGGAEESFPPVFAPFKLVVYDAAGNKLGEQTLDPNGLRSAAMADKEYLVSTAGTDAAFGVTGDEKLTVALPADAGQACFEGSPGAVSCMTWGTITKPVPMSNQGTGAVHGPVPANGESDQRATDNSVVTGPPTPKARNKAAAGGLGGGGGGGGMTAFAGVSFPKGSAKVDSHGRAHVSVTCPAGSGGCSGKLTLSAKHKSVGSATFKAAAGAKKSVTVKLSAAALKALKRNHKLKTTAVAKTKDAAGDSKRSSATIVLK